ncbi:MAG: hypothetical protein PW734_03000 [Verrucomicrobium sp.]|nr:hypothetical protein [Verrucomicrobium sp.]
MKHILSALPRILLGVLFTVFGLNGFFHFIPAPEMSGDAGAFMGAIFHSGYFAVIFACQLIGGVLLLLGRFVPLGLVFLGPVLVNILAFHATMAPSGAGPGIACTVLWLIVAYQKRALLAPFLRHH